jgi:hypothetical protein
MIQLIDLIKQAGFELGSYKIHCATGRSPTPLEAFYEGNFKEWQEYQNMKNFQCDHVVSLILLHGWQWLFAGVYKIDGVTEHSDNGNTYYLYQTTYQDELDHLAGRTIIYFEKKFRASYLKGSRYGEQLEIHSLLPEKMTIGDFDGYNDILLSYRNLKTIIRQENPSWKGSLSSIAGVYVISDTSTGELYVGSAYGDEGIWQRWSNYASTGHGDNKRLKELLAEKGIEHAQNFRFSLLEIADIRSSSEQVISRESHWKEVLLTRDFGFNAN